MLTVVLVYVDISNGANGSIEVDFSDICCSCDDGSGVGNLVTMVISV